MVKILFARHGRTNTNAEGVIAGHYEAMLTPEGISQAKELGKALIGRHIDFAYVSPLKRAQQTFKEAFPYHSFPCYTEDLLIERNFGKLEGQKNDGDYFGYWRIENQDKVSGETIQEVAARWEKFCNKIRKKCGGRDATILVVAHGGLGCVARAYFEGVPASGNYLEIPPIPNGNFAEWEL